MGDYISNYLEKIINDKNISRQGREMLILLKSLDSDGKNIIKITLRELLYKLDTQNRERVCNTLRELESKGYIAIDKSVGKVNTYTFLKEHLVGDDWGVEIESRVDTGVKVGVWSGVGVECRVGVLDETSYEGSIISGGKSKRESLPGYENSSKEILPCNENSRGENLLGFEDSRGESLQGDFYTRQENRTGHKGRSKEYLLGSEISSKENLPALGRSSEKSLPGYGLYNINNNINDLFINIFNHWNKQNISNISELDLRVRESINKALGKYSFESIIKAISNYSEVYHSDYFYNIKWNLNNFLTNSKAIDKFQDNGQMWQQYMESKFGKESVSYGRDNFVDSRYGDVVLDKYKYIDV